MTATDNRAKVNPGWGAPKTDPATDALAANPLFAGVPDADLAAIRAMLTLKRVPANGMIFEEEAPAHVIHIVRDGFVRVQTFDTAGADVILALLGPGDVLGEMSLVDRAVRSASVFAHEPAVIYTLERAQFVSLLERFPQVSRNLNAIMARRLRLSNAHIRALATLGVEGRIAHELLTYAREFGDPEGRLPFHLTQTELAAFVGASRVRVNQVMGEFRRLALLDWDDHHRITIRNPDELRHRYGNR